MSRINWPHPLLEQAWNEGVYQTGATEPWVQQLIASLLIASDQRNVLELGGYLGLTSVWLLDALQCMGGGTLDVVEIEEDRCKIILDTLKQVYAPDVTWGVYHISSIDYLQNLDTRITKPGFVFVDDCHEYDHVYNEICTLLPKVKAGGIVCMHDVDGLIPGNEHELGCICLEALGLSLKLPRLGPYAGGLGIIQL